MTSSCPLIFMSVPPAPVASILDLVGNTALVEATCFDTGSCRLFLKLENQNPGGSIKDRVALGMIRAAEESGDLKPGGTIVEATAGNTGLGLALVATLHGYRCVVVVPDKMSREKIFHLKALGADVRLTRSDVNKGHPEYYQDMAARLVAEIPGAWWANQFENPANPATHEAGTGPEILRQMDGDVDAIVCGAGSGGTITGIGRYMARHSPKTEMILADPEGSLLAQYVNHGTLSNKVGSWLVEGIGEDFIPPVSDLSLAKKAYTVSDADAFATIRILLKKEGILAGPSSGAIIATASRYCLEQTKAKRVVAMVCDSGNKYLSKAYNDYWMADQGFLETEPAGDLRDLIGRKRSERAVVTVDPSETLMAAFGRMKLHDVSQLPVFDGDKIVGIIDESDILLTVLDDESRFENPVRNSMTAKLETTDPSQPIDVLPFLFAEDKIAIVMDGNNFLGLITRIDLLNYLRQRTG
ncbi:MAG: pyridoxal-phosphate dependent enzyme [Rhodospirillaceae bacterium]|nr:pyridoxal-phosphate dependent enzyme [Rhodospirillaceae bacterium]